ncbi:ParB/RepB/Spo0J family partition protein [Leptospira langatensis]|uniref:ParB/RepB/Spo0J family partition protein n=1 Tax=Leptospira langatensis TaxID=2484983 RepID=A0A5R2AT19_9LEPT|nr:ParB/RepB/Spo0J family partition protein [Leptospira langatensis]TGJ99876.1 ParB/RepB/Spo0J family partition protein [Leptospira langatensis]
MTARKVFNTTQAFAGSGTKPSADRPTQSNLLLRELASNEEGPSAIAGYEKIPINRIQSENNPRTNFDPTSIKELAANIKEFGLIQPITVRKKGDTYFLIAGERRLRAVKLNGDEFIEAIIKNVDKIDPERVPEYKLIENIQREDLTDLEVALSISVIKSRKNLTVSNLVQTFHKSESWVKQKLAHASAINDLVSSGTISDASVIGKVPTSILMEVLPALKQNGKGVLSWLLPQAEAGIFPKQAEARQFAKSFKAGPKEEVGPGTRSREEILVASIERIDLKIAKLRKLKKKQEQELSLLRQ